MEFILPRSTGCKCVAAIGIVLSGIVVFAQGSALSPQTSQAPAVSPSASELLISARTKDGPVGELSAADLEIKENGNLVRIQQVRKLDQTPMRYCLLFDTSNSEREQFKRQQDTAIQLIQRIVRPSTDRGWVTLFSHVSEEGEETDNPDSVTRAIAASRPFGGTALYDAVAQCGRRMMQDPPDSFLRAMFLLSDGDDNQSHITHDRAIEIAALARIRIYAISPDDTRHAHGSSILKKFAESTGGRLFSPSRPKEVDKVTAEINDDVRNVFLVAYEAESHKPDSHPIRIEVKCAKRGVTVRAPKLTYP